MSNDDGNGNGNATTTTTQATASDSCGNAATNSTCTGAGGPVNGDDGGAAADENEHGGGRVTPVLVERTLDCVEDLDAALGDVLGFYGTPERIVEIRAMLCLADANQQQSQPEQMVARMNFRSWCGVVAFGERFLNRVSRTEDPCDEVCVVRFGVNVFSV